MTEKLKNLMDRTADQDFAAVDLDAVVSAGDRVVRRRRIALGGGVAALALVGGVAFAATGGTDRADGDRVTDDVATTAGTVRTDQTSWVIGRTLHTPSGTVALNVEPKTYVRTAAGYAFAGKDGTVLALVDGQQRVIGGGAVDLPTLTGDEAGSWVGWVDRSGAKPAFVSVDLATGKAVSNDEATTGIAEDVPIKPWYQAIDGTTAYWIDARGQIATDLVTGAERVLAESDQVRFVSDVTQGLLLGLEENEQADEASFIVTDPGGDIVLGPEKGQMLSFISPDGRWATSLDSGSFVEVRSGKEFGFKASKEDERQQNPYEWLSPTQVSLQVERKYSDGAGGGDLYTCTVPSGACEVVAKDLPKDVVLPKGFFSYEDDIQ